jgi:integrase
MPRVKLPYVDEFVDRFSKTRTYFRFKGKRWALPNIGSPGFHVAYERLKKAVRLNPSFAVDKKSMFEPGTLGAAIEAFTGDPNYIKDRAESTRHDERKVFDMLREKFGAGVMKDMTARHVKQIRETLRNDYATSTVDRALSLISIVWDYADEFLDLDLTVNPTTGVKRVHRAGKGHQPWPPEFIDRFMNEAPGYLGFAVRLALYTGQRLSDVVKMQWSQFDGHLIEVRQIKTDEFLLIPCHKNLRAELLTLPRTGGTILVGSRGKSLQGPSLSVMVRRQVIEMGMTGAPFHGLRKNAAQMLAEAGCSDREIMAITGHKTTQMVSLYTKQVQQRKMARSAMDKLEAQPDTINTGVNEFGTRPNSPDKPRTDAEGFGGLKSLN